MSDEAAAYYQELFKKVYDSPEWQEYRQKKSLWGEFLTGQDLQGYWTTELEIHRAMLEKMGSSNNPPVDRPVTTRERERSTS